MSDILEGLRLHATGVPLDGADVALVAGGRRRARRLAGWSISTGSIVVLTVAVLVHSATSGSSSLQINPADTPVPSVATLEPEVVPTPVSSALEAVPSTLPLVPGEQSPTPTPTPSPRPVEPATFIGHGPTDPADGGPVTTHGVRSNDPTFCAGKAGQVPTSQGPGGWCATLEGPSRLQIGALGTYTFTLCRDLRDGPAELHFSDRVPVGAFAQIEESQPFVWGSGTDFGGPAHTARFDSGDCFAWQFHWLGQDSNGYALPPGSYGLTALSAAQELTGPIQGPPPTIAVTLEG